MPGIRIELPAPAGVNLDEARARRNPRSRAGLQARWAKNLVLDGARASPRSAFGSWGDGVCVPKSGVPFSGGLRCVGMYAYRLSTGARRWCSWHEDVVSGTSFVAPYVMQGNKRVDNASFAFPAVDAKDEGVPVSAVVFEDVVLWCGPATSGRIYALEEHPAVGHIPLSVVNRDLDAKAILGQDPGPYEVAPPRARVLGVFQDRVMSAWDDTLRWSNILDYQGWPSDNFAVLSLGDTDAITAMGANGGSLVVSSADYIWTVSGDMQTYARTQIRNPVHAHGCVAPKTWARGGGGYFYLADDGVRWTDGVNMKHLSGAIDAVLGGTSRATSFRGAPDWRGNATMRKAWGVYLADRKWYVLAVPTAEGGGEDAWDATIAASTQTLWVLDVSRGEWMGPWEGLPGIEAGCAVELADESEAFVVADAQGYHWVMDDGPFDEYRTASFDLAQRKVRWTLRFWPVDIGDREDAHLTGALLEVYDDSDEAMELCVGDGEEDVDNPPAVTVTPDHTAKTLDEFIIGTTAIEGERVVTHDMGLAGLVGDTAHVEIRAEGVPGDVDAFGSQSFKSLTLLGEVIGGGDA